MNYVFADLGFWRRIAETVEIKIEKPTKYNHFKNTWLLSIKYEFKKKKKLNNPSYYLYFNIIT